MTPDRGHRIGDWLLYHILNDYGLYCYFSQRSSAGGVGGQQFFLPVLGFELRLMDDVPNAYLLP